jgi:hypothetical protein
MTEWSVLVEAFAPAGQPGGLDVHGSRFSDFVEALVKWHGSTGANNETWSARITVDADDIGDAIVMAREIIEGVARQCRLPMWRIERIDAIEGDRQASEVFGRT